MQPSPAPHKHGLRLAIATSVVVVVIVIAVLWAEAPIIFPPKSGHSVTLLGINRTLTYQGSQSGYVTGSIVDGCPVCPLVIKADTTVIVNVSWFAADPLSSGLHFVFVNWTIRSPFPFLAPTYSPGNRPSVYAWHDSWEAGGAGGFEGVVLTISIPLDSNPLPQNGFIQEWMNASAF